MKLFKTFYYVLMFILGAYFCNGQDSNTGLVAHWSFDGHCNDSTTNEINGRGYEVDYVDGVLGKAVSFNSVSDRVFFPDKNVFPEDRIANLDKGTISVWFKYQSIGTTGNILPILYFGESSVGSSHNSLIIEIGHGGNPANRKLYFTIINQRFCFDSNVNLNENEWYHFAAVVGDNYNTGYLNGVEMTNRHYNLGSDNTYSTFFNDVPVKEMLSIGYGRFGQKDPFYTFKGAIDDVRIYDKALTGAEIEKLYRSAPIINNPYPNCPLPTYEDIKYGKYERNVLDFWQADSQEPSPLVVFIHGGGFINGSKLQARTAKFQDIKSLLDAGISYASISYRLRSKNLDSLSEGTRLDTIMLDCARAIQYLRSKADAWNIDKGRIAAYGGSAGGGASLWIGTNDDLANPESADPVLRESSRLSAIGHLNSQATYYWQKWPEILEMDSITIFTNVGKDDVLTWQMPREEMYSDEGQQLGEFLDMHGRISSDDPPVYTQNANENVVPGNVIHHPRHSIAINKKCKEKGVYCTIILKDTEINERISFANWVAERLEKPLDNKKNLLQGAQKLRFTPNPASDYIRIEPKDGKFQKIGVFSTDGRLLIRHKPNAGDSIYIGNLPEGSYIVKAVDENRRVYSAKLLVN